MIKFVVSEGLRVIKRIVVCRSSLVKFMVSEGTWIDVMSVERCGLYTYEELAQLKIERELRTSYIVEAKKAETFARALVAKLPRLANAWGQEN